MIYNQLTSIKPNMRLLGVQSADTRKVKILKNDIENDFLRYADMFHKAGKQIAIKLLNSADTDIEQLDTFFFSLTFIYRHCIELMLKAVGFKCITAKRDRKMFIKDTFHNLEKIFQKVDCEYSVPMLANKKNWLAGFLSDISSIDAASDSFRYPFHIHLTKDQQGKKQYSVKRIFEKQTTIDLKKIVCKFEVAYHILLDWYHNTNQFNFNDYQNLSTTFLEDGAGYYSVSVVGYEYCKEDFEPYIDAYCETAGFLRDYMENLFQEGKYSEACEYFIPMCYLYRNCVELAEKYVLFEIDNKTISEKCDTVLKHKHSVEGLWNAIEPEAKECRSAIRYPNTLSLLKSYCLEIHRLDPQAICFRYPINKNIDPLFVDNKRFDFGKVAAFFEGVINTIRGIGSELHEMNIFREERESEWIEEMKYEMTCLTSDY